MRRKLLQASKRKHVTILQLLVVALSGCKSPQAPAQKVETDTGMGATNDSDTGALSDTGLETDDDTDTGSPSDPDTGLDTDTDVSVDSDTDSDTDTDVDTDVDTDTGAETDPEARTQWESEASASALEQLTEWLKLEVASRPPLGTEPFSEIPLSSVDSESAEELLWRDLAGKIRSSRQSEVDEKSLSYDGFVLKYDSVVLGGEPAGGRSLFISMHGGGSAPKETNDGQWENQIALAASYSPKDTLWIAPRAPTDDWNMWFKDHIDPLFDRLISNMIVFEKINPNKVYLTGYSAGGDAVYQLGPRMADRWAAAAMSAGHPNAASPINLRNIGFAIHVGGDDSAFDRNLVALDWGQQLDELQLVDPEAYPHQVQVHEGLPHWMNLADQVSIPYVQSFERDPTPQKVIWRQANIPHERFYWLHVELEDALENTQITAEVNGQIIDVETTESIALTIRVSDELVDMDQPVTINLNGSTVFEGLISRTIIATYSTLAEREDPEMSYPGQMSLSAN